MPRRGGRAPPCRCGSRSGTRPKHCCRASPASRGSPRAGVPRREGDDARAGRPGCARRRPTLLRCSTRSRPDVSVQAWAIQTSRCRHGRCRMRAPHLRYPCCVAHPCSDKVVSGGETARRTRAPLGGALHLSDGDITALLGRPVPSADARRRPGSTRRSSAPDARRWGRGRWPRARRSSRPCAARSP